MPIASFCAVGRPADSTKQPPSAAEPIPGVARSCPVVGRCVSISRTPLRQTRDSGRQAVRKCPGAGARHDRRHGRTDHGPRGNESPLPRARRGTCSRLALEGRPGPAGAAPDHRRPYAAGHFHGLEIPPLRPAAGRPRPGRPCRAAGGGGAFRAGARGALLDLCDLVDPRLDAGLHPAQLVDRARRHLFGAKGAVLQPAAPARPAGQWRRADLQRHALPRNLGSARRLRGRCRDDGFQAFGTRLLAQRAARRRSRHRPSGWIS